jgi:hypothetical protein
MTTIEVTPQRLGRRAAPDPRDRAYPMRALVPRKVPQKTRLYRTGPILDQGFAPICVGAAWRQWLSSALLMTKGGPDMLTIYREAQDRDEWDGNAYEGTSVRGGVKAIQDRGHVASYVWSDNADVLRDYMLAGLGGVVIGINWYESMFEPDKNGYLRIGGSVVGGHAIYLGGYSIERDADRAIQSWGREWGDNGRAWIRHADLRRLLSEDGEGCAATEQKVAPVPV